MKKTFRADTTGMANATRRGIEEKGFEEILEKDFYVIPSYQRNYSWDEYNLRALWDDVLVARDKRVNAREHGMENISVGNHFMSSILVKERGDGDKTKHIVDGQQRLLTITLFLHAARELLSPETAAYESVDRSLYGDQRILNPETGRRTKKLRIPRVTLQNQPEGNAYEVLVGQGSSAIQGENKESRIYTNYRFFRSRLTKVQDEGGEGLLEDTVFTVLENLRIIYIPILASEAPQKIFESVNGLTKRLFAGELIKNHVLMSMSDEELVDETYRKYWAVFDDHKWARDDKTKASLTKMLYYWVNSKGVDCRSNDEDVYRGFKSYLLSQVSVDDDANAKAIEISKDLNDTLLFCDKWSNISNPNGDRLGLFFKRVYGVRQGINSMTFFMRFQALVRELEMQYERELTYSEIDSMIAPMESYIVRRMFSLNEYTSGSSKYLIKVMNAAESTILTGERNLEECVDEFSKALVEGLETSKAINAEWVGNDELFDHIAGNTEEGIFPHTFSSSHHDLAKLLLVEVENHIRSKNPFINPAPYWNQTDFTVEHWLPQNPNPGEWNLNNKMSRAKCTNALGNLAVLPQRINSSLGNRSLYEKLRKVREFMEQADDTSTGLKTLDWIIENAKNGEGDPDWRESHIEERSRNILHVAFNEMFPDIDHFKALHGGAVAEDEREMDLGTNLVGDTTSKNTLTPGMSPLPAYAERQGVDPTLIILSALGDT